jgi:hypothetical protein
MFDSSGQPLITKPAARTLDELKQRLHAKISALREKRKFSKVDAENADSESISNKRRKVELKPEKVNKDETNVDSDDDDDDGDNDVEDDKMDTDQSLGAEEAAENDDSVQLGGNTANSKSTAQTKKPIVSNLAFSSLKFEDSTDKGFVGNKSKKKKSSNLHHLLEKAEKNVQRLKELESTEGGKEKIQNIQWGK